MINLMNFRSLILILLVITPFYGNAQTGDDGERTISMLVVVMNMEEDVKPGEKIVFVDTDSGKQFSGITGDDGTFETELPGGTTYEVKIAGLGEYEDYQTVTIPELEPDKRYGQMQFTIKYEAPKVYTLDNVYFDVNRATLREGSYTALDELVQYLKRKQHVRVEIAGHTDSTGDKEHNKKLSLQRAKRVKSYLVKQGIDAARIEAKGYGEEQPVADNATEAGKQKNRRTEVRFIKN